MDGRSAATTALRAASTACVIGGDLVTPPQRVAVPRQLKLWSAA